MTLNISDEEKQNERYHLLHLILLFPREKLVVLLRTTLSPNGRGVETKYKETKCVFAPNLCRWEGSKLHKVESNGRGRQLVDINKSITNDSVRAALAMLSDNDPSDAKALELHYHDNCLRDADRTCKITSDMSSAQLIRKVYHAQILLFLQSSLLTPPFRLDMSSLNANYLLILDENKADCHR